MRARARAHTHNYTSTDIQVRKEETRRRHTDCTIRGNLLLVPAPSNRRQVIVDKNNCWHACFCAPTVSQGKGLVMVMMMIAGYGTRDGDDHDRRLWDSCGDGDDWRLRDSW